MASIRRPTARGSPPMRRRSSPRPSTGRSGTKPECCAPRCTSRIWSGDSAGDCKSWNRPKGALWGSKRGWIDLGMVRSSVPQSAGAKPLRAVRSLTFADGEENPLAVTFDHPGNGEESGESEARKRVQRVRLHIRQLLPLLTPREAEVVTLRLGLNGTEPIIQREIGAMLGVTRGTPNR